MRRRVITNTIVGLTLLVVVVGTAACGSDDGEPAAAATDDSTAVTAAAASSGVRLVSPEAGAAIIDDPPPGLVVLDVRTGEEFAEGHLADATMLDFYRDDFAERLAELDPDTPYLIYCRSGNRSGQTRALMEELGFTDVVDVDGGILAWGDAGLPIDG